MVITAMGGVASQNYRRTAPEEWCDPAEVAASLYSYVNAFGSWADASEIAIQLDQMPLDTRNDSLVQAAVAIVLALTGSGDHSVPFRAAIEADEHPLERFFTRLRWASIEAKRAHNLDSAIRIMAEADRDIAESSNQLFESDVAMLCGMSANFDALVRVRSGDLDGARKSSARAVALMENLHGPAQLGERERRRYVWMARFNWGQLLWQSGDRSGAIEHLREVREYAAEHDQEIILTSSGGLALYLLQEGRSTEALPFAREASRHAHDSYDADLVIQVDKLLLRALLELGQTIQAEAVRSRGPFFWQIDKEDL